MDVVVTGACRPTPPPSLAKALREALDECAVTNEIEIADHHLDYFANWALEAGWHTLLAEGEIRESVLRGVVEERVLVVPLAADKDPADA